MLHPTEQYGQIVVVCLAFLIFSSWAVASSGESVTPTVLRARVPPVNFRKSLLDTLIRSPYFFDLQPCVTKRLTTWNAATKKTKIEFTKLNN
jgi:hypothetical protein